MHVQNARRLYFENVPVCAGTTPARGNTCVCGAGTHGDVLNLHTGFFSVSRHTPRSHHSHNDTQPQPHTRQRQRQRHTTNLTTTSTNQPEAQFHSTRENSPGQDAARIHRLIALSSLLNSVKYDSSLISFRGPGQVNSFKYLRIINSMQLQFSFFDFFGYAVTVSNFSEIFSYAATVFFSELILHKYSVEGYVRLTRRGNLGTSRAAFSRIFLV